MIPVVSSAMTAVGYDKNTQQMYIKFKQGHIYTFCRVPEGVFLELISATSKGRYYANQIEGKYQC